MGMIQGGGPFEFEVPFIDSKNSSHDWTAWIKTYAARDPKRGGRQGYCGRGGGDRDSLAQEAVADLKVRRRTDSEEANSKFSRGGEQ